VGWMDVRGVGMAALACWRKGTPGEPMLPLREVESAPILGELADFLDLCGGQAFVPEDVPATNGGFAAGGIEFSPACRHEPEVGRWLGVGGHGGRSEGEFGTLRSWERWLG
jgi:hypothetical protein